MMSASWTALRPLANSLAIGFMYFSATLPFIACIWKILVRQKENFDQVGSERNRLTKVCTLPPGQYSEAIHT